MTRLRSAGLCLAIALWLPSVAAAADCKVEFDAASRAWSLARCANPSKTDINGVPTVYVGRKDTVTVTIVEVNPLLYAVNLGDVSTEKLPVVKDLASIFLGFGGVFRGILASALAPPPPPPPPGADAPPKPPLQALVDLLKDHLGAFIREESALITSLQRLEFTSPVNVAAPSKALQQWENDFARLRAAYLKDSSPEDGPLKKEASALLDKSREIIKNVAITKLIARRACFQAAAASAAGASCGAEPAGTFAVSRRLEAWSGRRMVSWDEVATYPLTISRQSAYADSVATDLPEKIETKFRISSTQGSLFSVGLGLTNSDVIDSQWAAVASPASPEKKIVTLTQQTTRAAVKSLLATHTLSHKTREWLLRPLVEFGTSLEADAPAAFLGLGVRAGKYIHVAAGRTHHKIKMLDGQVAGVTEVTEDKAIKTRDEWVRGRYWSFSFNITGLPFFSRD